MNISIGKLPNRMIYKILILPVSAKREIAKDIASNAAKRTCILSRFIKLMNKEFMKDVRQVAIFQKLRALIIVTINDVIN